MELEKWGEDGLVFGEPLTVFADGSGRTIGQFDVPVYAEYVNLAMSQIAEPKTFEQVVQLQLSANASRQLDAVAAFLDKESG